MIEYLRKNKMHRVFFDPFQPKVDNTDWKDFYGYIKEELTTGMPESLGKNSHTTCFFNAN